MHRAILTARAIFLKKSVVSRPIRMNRGSPVGRFRENCPVSENLIAKIEGHFLTWFLGTLPPLFEVRATSPRISARELVANSTTPSKFVELAGGGRSARYREARFGPRQRLWRDVGKAST